MELFQSSLLHYWESTPKIEGDIASSSEETKVEHTEHEKERSGESERSADRSAKKPREKKVPVIFFDEAHKLYVLDLEARFRSDSSIGRRLFAPPTR